MSKYHLTAKGEPGVCRAKPGNCPLGSDSEHFTSADAARTHFENNQGAVLAGARKAEKKTGKSTPPKTAKEFYAGLANVPTVGNSKVVKPPKTADQEGYMGGRRYVGAGVEDKFIGQSEASTRLKELVKQAKLNGELPQWLDVSVRKNGGAWVSSISVVGGYKPEGGRKIRAIPQEWLYEPKDETDFRQRDVQRPEVKNLQTYLDTLSRTYESSDINSMVDYYNSSNAGHFQWRGKWEDRD